MTPPEPARHLLDLVRRHSRSVCPADESTGRCPDDHVDRHLVLGQSPQRSDVREAASASARQHECDLRSNHKASPFYRPDGHAGKPIRGVKY